METLNSGFDLSAFKTTPRLRMLADRGCDIGHAVIVPDSVMPVFRARHEPLPAQAPAAIDHGVIARKDHAAFAGRDRLVAEKAERRDVAQECRRTIPVTGSERFRAILDHHQAMAPGAPWAICITPPPNQVLYSSDGYPGRIYKLTLDGKVLGVLGESGKQLKQFGWIHEIACPSENELFVGELLNWRVQKLILSPVH